MLWQDATMASTLTGTSTDAEVWAAYDDNASYEEDASRAKALSFTTACRILLRRRPSRSAFGSRASQNLVEFDAAQIAAELKAASRWLDLHSDSTGKRTRFADFSDFRDDTSGGTDE